MERERSLAMSRSHRRSFLSVGRSEDGHVRSCPVCYGHLFSALVWPVIHRSYIFICPSMRTAHPLPSLFLPFPVIHPFLPFISSSTLYSSTISSLSLLFIGEGEGLFYLIKEFTELSGIARRFIASSAPTILRLSGSYIVSSTILRIDWPSPIIFAW